MFRAIGIENGDTLLMTTTDHQILMRKPESVRRKTWTFLLVLGPKKCPHVVADPGGPPPVS